MQLPVPVFVSSTFDDLRPERHAIERALNRLLEAKFIGMEFFGSRDEMPRTVALEAVGQSRLYIGIIAGRYGSGITEAEYRRAKEIGLECLFFLKRDEAIPARVRRGRCGEERQAQSVPQAGTPAYGELLFNAGRAWANGAQGVLPLALQANSKKGT